MHLCFRLPQLLQPLFSAESTPTWAWKLSVLSQHLLQLPGCHHDSTDHLLATEWCSCLHDRGLEQGSCRLHVIGFAGKWKMTSFEVFAAKPSVRLGLQEPDPTHPLTVQHYFTCTSRTVTVTLSDETNSFIELWLGLLWYNQHVTAIQHNQQVKPKVSEKSEAINLKLAV